VREAELEGDGAGQRQDGDIVDRARGHGWTEACCHGRILARVGRRATVRPPAASAMLSVVTSTAAPRTHRVHPAWWVAGVTFLALVGAAAR
jgi:hypothetical protein